MAYIDGYAKGMAKELKDDKVRAIYYFLGILSCSNWKNDKIQNELDDLKKALNNLGYMNISSYSSMLITHAKNMLKKQDEIDDFFVLADSCLLEARKLAMINNRDEVKAFDLLIAITSKKYYWTNPNFKINQKSIENIIKDKLSKAFILTFYYKNVLSYEVHIASNAKEIILGRDQYSDIRFSEKHADISRKHCMITCHNNHYYIQDLGSTQSTTVNDILHLSGSGATPPFMGTNLTFILRLSIPTITSRTSTL